MEFVKVFSTKDLTSDTMRCRSERKKILIVNHKYYDRECLCALELLDFRWNVFRRKHPVPMLGSTYSVKTGSVVTGQTKKPVPMFQVKVKKVFVSV